MQFETITEELTIEQELAAFDSSIWPNPADPCYDCGSRESGHHTKLCDFAESGDTLDLDAEEGSQHWNGKYIQ